MTRRIVAAGLLLGLILVGCGTGDEGTSGSESTGGASSASGGAHTVASGGTSSGGSSTVNTGGGVPIATGGSATGGAFSSDGGPASGGFPGSGGRDGGMNPVEPPDVDAGVDSSPPMPDCTDGKVVHFVYFVEADQSFEEAERAAIEEQAFRFQQYWYEQLGVTFYLNRPVVDVIEGDETAAWYVETPDGIHGDPRWYRLGNIKNEVYRKLGIANFDADHRVVSYPTTRYDGRVGGNFGGAWMDGDDLSCLLGENGGVNYPYEGGASAHCMGHVAHEFGHVLGLDHEGPSTDCMQFGFYNNSGGSGMCSFSDANVAKILGASQNAGWFEALPGETCSGA